MKQAVGERAAELFVEEDEHQGDFGPFVGEPVGVASAIALKQSVSFHLAEIVAKLIQPIASRGEVEGGEQGGVDVFGPPATDGCTAVQQNPSDGSCGCRGF